MTIQDVFDKFGVEYVEYGQHHHVSHGWLNVDCPECSPSSNHFRLGFNLSRKWFNCWVCGRQPTVLTLAKVLGVPHRTAVLLLEGLGASYNETEAPRGKLELPAGRRPLLKQHRSYLERRGFDPKELTELWKIEGIGIASKLSWRIFIPAILDNKTVSWTTRSISDSVDAKYITAKRTQESYPLKGMLYGEQYCTTTIIVNEGPLDAWAIGPGAVATCGMSYSLSQLLRMSKYPIRVVCFDNEPEAQRRADVLCNDLSIFDGETYNVVLSGKDASRSPKREIKELRRRFL